MLEIIIELCQLISCFYNFYLESMEKSYKFKYQSSKKALEAITRYNYYIQQIIPDLFPNQTQKNESNREFFQFATGKSNLLYFWGQNYFQDQPFVNEQSIMHAAKLTQLAKMSQFDTILKINERSYQKISRTGGSLFTYPWNVSQVLEFLLKSEENKTTRKTKFQFYIIHHCQNEQIEDSTRQLKWLNFVQKYVFEQEGISYNVLLVANLERAYFGLQDNQKILQNFIKSEMKFEIFQGHLLQYKDIIKQKIKQDEDPAFSEEHKLINHIPSQFIKMFYTLKKEFGPENQSLICRFMIARQFNLQQCRTGIKQYLQWYTTFSKKFKWEDFKEFQEQKIFYYLGQDYKGRPVILNKAKNVLVDQIDGDKYCNFYMYFLQIYMPTKMRGHVYQINIIADVEDIGQKNFKLAITKQNIQDGKRYCVERQYKFFAVNVAPFANFCWRFIKPLLPKKTLQKVYVGGNGKEQIVEGLLKDMSIDVIPTYLGGKNPII